MSDEGDIGELRGIVNSTVRRLDRMEDKLSADLTALNGKLDLVLTRMAENQGAGRFRNGVLDWIRLILAALAGALSTHFIH